MTEVLTYEALKADRDAQQNRADALAVENAALKSLSIKLFNLGYLHGHESTVEGCFVDIHRNDIDTYHDDVVAEIIEDEEETPATSAALAAVRTQGVEQFIAEMLESGNEPTNSLTESVRADMRSAATFARLFIELREAK